MFLVEEAGDEQESEESAEEEGEEEGTESDLVRPVIITPPNHSRVLNYMSYYLI